MATPIYPLCFWPVYKDYIWGGDRIIRLYQRQEPPGRYAESWEISDRPDGMSMIRNGPLAGKSLADVIQTAGPELLGTAVKERRFPLLIKLIDSRDRLSVQVHPDDDTAKRFGGEAKTEMWYVLDSDAGAGVFAGLKQGADEQLFRDALKSKRFRELLTFVPVSRGDAVFVPGGRVHAIDAGCLLLEVQQNSNTTYRIYDWDRVGSDGKPRELHINEALRVIRWKESSVAKTPPRKLDSIGSNERWEVIRCAYFRMERMVLKSRCRCAGDERTFQALFVPKAGVTLHWDGQSLPLPPGTSCLVPASLRECFIEPAGAESEVLRVTVV